MKKINLARYAYLLARMEPGDKAPDENKKLYQEFSQKMYQWMLDEKHVNRRLRHSTFMYIPFGKPRRVSEYENQ